MHLAAAREITTNFEWGFAAAESDGTYSTALLGDARHDQVRGHRRLGMRGDAGLELWRGYWAAGANLGKAEDPYLPGLEYKRVPTITVPMIMDGQ